MRVHLTEIYCSERARDPKFICRPNVRVGLTWFGTPCVAQRVCATPTWQLRTSSSCSSGSRLASSSCSAATYIQIISFVGGCFFLQHSVRPTHLALRLDEDDVLAGLGAVQPDPSRVVSAVLQPLYSSLTQCNTRQAAPAARPAAAPGSPACCAG